MSDELDESRKNGGNEQKQDVNNDHKDESSKNWNETDENTEHKNNENENRDPNGNENNEDKNGKYKNGKHKNGKKNGKHKNGKHKKDKKSRSVAFEEELQQQNSAELVKKFQDVSGLLQQRTWDIRRQQPTDWSRYSEKVGEGVVSSINALQQAETNEQKEELFKNSQETLYQSFADMLESIDSYEDMQKFLVLVNDFLIDDESRMLRMNEATPQAREAIQELLTSGDEIIRHTASQIITKLIFVHNGRVEAEDIRFFLGWLKEGMKLDNGYLQSVIQCLQKLMIVDEYRLEFMEMDGIKRLICLLTHNLKPQLQYQICFCLWAVTFNCLIAEKLDRSGIIPVLMDLLEWCPAEITKLPRVITGCVRNLLERPQSYKVRRRNALLSVQCKILQHLDLVETNLQKIDDPEFMEDFEQVREIVKSTVQAASSFEEYDCELRSGRLRWSIVHTEKNFWEKNAERLNDNEHELLAMLVGFLQESEDGMVLTIACHDLGEYMKHFPRGKAAIEKLGGKEALLKLLDSTNNEVKGYALKSLQIFMLGHHDLLNQLQSGNGSHNNGSKNGGS